MNQHTPEPREDFETLPGPEPPRIYVASLSDYNAGRLHGSWIDVTRDEDDVWKDVNTMLSNSPELGAEEFAIHDHEGFEGWQPSEYEPISTVIAVAQAIVEHGSAISHWLDYCGTSDTSTFASFQDAYLGEWPSMKDYAEHLVEDLGLKITVEPDSWRHYVQFNTDALARDLQIELATGESEHGIYIFDPSSNR